MGDAIALTDWIYEYQLEAKWERVPGMYKQVCNLLARVQGEASALTLEEKEYVLGAAAELASVEQDITRRQQDGLTPDDAAEMNQVVTKHGNRFITIKTDLGRRGEA